MEHLRWLLLVWFWNLWYGVICLLILISFQFKLYMILVKDTIYPLQLFVEKYEFFNQNYQ